VSLSPYPVAGLQRISHSVLEAVAGGSSPHGKAGNPLIVSITGKELVFLLQKIMTPLKRLLMDGLDAISRTIQKRKIPEIFTDGDNPFLSAFDHSSIGMALVSLEGRWIRVNRSMSNILGYSLEELMKMTFQDVTHPDDLHEDLENRRRLLAAEISSYQMEKRCFHKSGAIIWVLLSVSLAHDEIGNPLLFITQIEDITKAKQSVDLLRISDIALRSVSQGILITDARRIITSANPAFSNITGYREKDVVGRQCKFLQGPLSDPETVAAIRASLNNETDFSGEILNYREDGSIFWNDLSISPVHDEKGDLVHFVGIARDVTAMRNERASLSEKNALLSSIFKASINGYMIADSNRTKLYQNDQFTDLYGIPYDIASDAGHQTQLEWVANTVKERDDFLAKVEDLYSDPGKRSNDIIELKNGKILDRFSGPIMSDQGECFGRIWCLRDITEERNRERLVREVSDRALSADRAKSEFLAVMSHELRTPLSGIIGYTDLLLDEKGLSSTVYDHLKIILSSGEGLLRVIEDIMEFSQAEGGKSSPQIREVSLPELAWECIRIVEPEANAKSLPLSVLLDENLPPSVEGDPDRIRRVLINLLRNAVKFTARGKIILRLDAVSKSEGINTIRFAISDTGPGIPSEFHEKIFLPFTQVDSTLSRKHEGVGLGLAISEALLLKMGGKLTLESQPGKGSQFSFELRLPSVVSTISERSLFLKEADVLTIREVPFSQLHPSRILAVEDNEINLRFQIAILKSLGYQNVLTATNGEEAVAIFQQGQVDFIFMDIQMPVMDGITATREIRALELMNSQKPPVWIVALTANISTSVRNECFKVGMNNYLSKPYNKRSIAEAIALHHH